MAVIERNVSCVPGAPNVEPSSGFRLQFTITVNRVQLIGNLGRDPEVRTTQSGGRVVTLSIATSEKTNAAASVANGLSGTAW